MRSLASTSSMADCPASAVIAAARMAKTPLAIAESTSPEAVILFANDAFAEMLGCDAEGLNGRPLGSLAGPSTPVSAAIADGRTVRLDVVLADGRSFPAALSVAAVNGPDGAAFCLLCSLMDLRGAGAEIAVARDAEMLAQVARAASDLMSESGAAAGLQHSRGDDVTPSDIALSAVEHAAVGASANRS